MNESEKFSEIHDKIKSFVDVKDFNSVNEFIKSFLNNESSVGDLKSILVITKGLKDNEVICNTRKNIIELLESKIGQKLI
jgi:hypothetical protein